MDTRSRKFRLMNPFKHYEVSGGRDGSSKSGSSWPMSAKFTPKIHKMSPPPKKKLAIKCCVLFLIVLFTRWACPSSGVPLSLHQLMLQSESCQGRRVHMYDIPPSFNTALLQFCEGGLVHWIKFCKHYQNHGFGERVMASASMFRDDWYRTDAYMLEVIFFERMKSYQCLTDSPVNADIFYVPFFAGLDALPYLYNESMRLQQQGLELLDWLRQNATESWRRYGGQDHFMIAGRTAWDFAHPEEGGKDWGTSLFDLDAMKHVTFMVLERRPWRPNEQAIPYPVGFHPSSSASLELWIHRVRDTKRTALFSFSGALRPGQVGSIRDQLSQQCANASTKCSRLDCATIKCSHNPEPIYDSLLQADFCLQPRGDTATRRSTIDSIVSGCIPVLFHKDTAETQYTWHLPSDLDTYSVFIPEDCVMNGTCIVKDSLKQITPAQVRKMREKLISMIPNVLYRYPSGTDFAQTVTDAFDLAIEGMRQKVDSLKASQ
uniref:Exostosin GT47 domain-containing protein n=3 Tax=Physcomitrium patens TaxID=3218 RepID=A0A2K1JLG0_PHYPA|nr:xyloglucan galactosyltransferase KATAMARI1 homolog isoform X2 [Physcomitrium patens]PNR42371.1 hypothetical protein PHYPA_017200 [Physcomitrium patens]|eukprot:XP_024391983.1 xyloglucan galactosyltransferase KATAMARI1 homolog isoform X2 [Physcomitrella patens]